MNYEDPVYTEYKKEIVGKYLETKSWEEVFISVVYGDIDVSMEAFVDYVEEVFNTKIQNAEQLVELTGLKEEPIDAIEEIITIWREKRYLRALENVLATGGKYQDLLKIEPSEYGLPKTWTGFFEEPHNKNLAIKWAIYDHFDLMDEPGNPALTQIAEKLDVPYSFIMEVLDEFDIFED